MRRSLRPFNLHQSHRISGRHRFWIQAALDNGNGGKPVAVQVIGFSGGLKTFPVRQIIAALTSNGAVCCQKCQNNAAVQRPD